MNRADDEKLRGALREVFPPIGDSTPDRDLWPRVLGRLADQRGGVSPLDWGVILAVGLWLMLFPQLILALIYHL